MNVDRMSDPGIDTDIRSALGSADQRQHLSRLARQTGIVGGVVELRPRIAGCWRCTY